MNKILTVIMCLFSRFVVSLGVHESQSRIFENQLGRSRAFTSWLFHRMRDLFGNFGIKNPETFYKYVNRVDTGYIRTEADELQYNLHVMLRFDLEKLLIAGDLNVSDVEGAWNERFEADFGYKVERPSQGFFKTLLGSRSFGYFSYLYTWQCVRRVPISENDNEIPNLMFLYRLAIKSSNSMVT